MKEKIEERIKNVEEELKQVRIELEKISAEPQLYDLVHYSGFGWYVIDIVEDCLKLISKDIVAEMRYSDENSNDYKTSNVEKYLETEFINKLNAKDLILMQTNYDEDCVINTLVRIPTLREIEKLKMDIRGCNEPYWTMTSSYGVSGDFKDAFVFYVGKSGYLNSTDASSALGVRPVITVKNDVKLERIKK